MSMADRDGKIWIDGALVDWRDAKVHVLTHTLHYGCGAFEGVRAYNTANGTAIFRLREHTERLFNSAKILRMIAEGRRNREIAGMLYVSVKTVEKHRSNLMNKLDLHNTAALTSFAVESGLVGGSDPGLRRLASGAGLSARRARPGEPQ